MLFLSAFLDFFFSGLFVGDAYVWIPKFARQNFRVSAVDHGPSIFVYDFSHMDKVQLNIYMTCQAHPAFGKIGPVLVPSFQI